MANRSHAAYAEYVSLLPAGLPDSILRINRGMLPDAFFIDPDHAIELHDARIATVASTDRSLRLILKVDHNNVYSQVTLDYSGVSAFVPIAPVLLWDVPDSDLMCHETTVLDPVGFNHKMLFACSDILSIDFEHLIVHVAPVDP